MDFQWCFNAFSMFFSLFIGDFELLGECFARDKGSEMVEDGQQHGVAAPRSLARQRDQRVGQPAAQRRGL